MDIADGDLLQTLFGSEGDDDLASLLQVVSAGEKPTLPADEDLEALMRETWGLQSLDVSKEIRQASNISVRPDDRDEDDYSEEEWLVVTTMRKLCLEAITRTTPARRRKRAIEWLFINGTEEPRNSISFHLACDLLKARPWVIQALIQHFWYLRGIEPEPLPFLADILPDAILSEAGVHAWEPGMRIASNLWQRPGSTIQELRDVTIELSSAEFDTAASLLVEHGIIGVSVAGKAYVISRPATFRHTGQKVSWSRSFIGE